MPNNYTFALYLSVDAIHFYLGIFDALFLFAFIMSKKNRSKADSVLTIAFLLFGLNILSAFLEWQNRTSGYAYLFFIQATPPFILLHGTVLWFYIKYQTEQNFKFRAIHLFHFFTFCFVAVGLYLLGIFLARCSKNKPGQYRKF